MRFPITIGATGLPLMLYFSVHTKQMDPYIFHIALNQHRDLNIKMEHGEGIFDFHHGVDTLEGKGKYGRRYWHKRSVDFVQCF